MKHDFPLPCARRELGSGGLYARIWNAKPNQMATQFRAIESRGGGPNRLSEPAKLRRHAVMRHELAHPVTSGVETGSERDAKPAGADNGNRRIFHAGRISEDASNPRPAKLTR